MEIFKYTDDFIKLYSTGIETDYRGTSIVYDDTTKTLLYFYYPHFQKLYIIDGTKAETQLANVAEKVRIIAIYRGREVTLFSRYMKQLIKSKELFYMDDDFFVDIMIMLRGKRAPFSDILRIYNFHTRKGLAHGDTNE